MSVNTTTHQNSSGVSAPAGAGSARRDAEPPKTPGRAGGRRYVTRVVLPLVVFVGFLGVWYFISYALLSERRRFLLPPPQDVISVGFLDWHNFSEILAGLGATALVSLCGFAVAGVLGFAFAVAMAQTSWMEHSFYPYAVALQTLPVLAMTPLVGLWFGFDVGSRILICSVLAVFPIITNTLFGLKSVEPSQRDLFALMKAGRFTRLWRLEIPAALPNIFTGLRISGGLAVIGSIVADFFFRQGDPGIGRLLDIYRAALETERLYAAIICSSLLGLALFLANTLLSRRVLRNWHASVHRSSR